MPLLRRAYHGEDDYWKLRQFLRETFLLNQRHEVNWPLYRWDYWRWHVNANIFRFDLAEVISFWETEQGQLVAALHPDGRSEAVLEIHPAWRTRALEAELLAHAEAHAQDALTVWTHASDTARQDLLHQRGYTRDAQPEYQRRRALETALPVFQAPAGYVLRALGDEQELPARSWISWKAFHPEEPDDRYAGWEWYRNVQRAPLYRRDLDLVAVAPNGDLAAFCTLWFDDVTRTAAFEPVGTHPEHQRRGLGQALMTEGLRRVRALGATLVTVGGYSAAANGLYASVGFTEYDLSEPWTKTR